MGMAPLFLCFKNQQPNCMAFTGLGASVLAFAFLIWGVADLEFKRGGVEAIYIIAFVLVILCMLGFIALLIFLNLRRTESFRTINNLGRIICLVILCMCGVAFLFMLIAFIILIVDYAKFNSKLKSDGDDDDDDIGDIDDLEDIINQLKKVSDYSWGFALDGALEGKIAGHEWGALFVPSIISLIALVVMALVANILYKVFLDNMNSTPNPMPVNITQNTMSTIPNYPQPGILPNNNGPVPPMVNNVAYPVTIQQSGVNLNK